MDAPEPDDLREDARRIASLIGLVFGAVLHLVVGLFVFTTGLVAPWWAWFGLMGVWLVGARLMWRWRGAPIRTMLVPFGTAAVWWATVMAGDVWLGWTA